MNCVCKLIFWVGGPTGSKQVIIYDKLSTEKNKKVFDMLSQKVL